MSPRVQVRRENLVAAASRRTLLGMAVVAGFSPLQSQAQLQVQETPVPERGFWLATSMGADGTVLDLRRGGIDSTEFALRVSPGLRLTSRSGALQGYLNYTGSFIHRSGSAVQDSSEYLNALDTSWRAELAQGRLFVDARAGISQQSIAPYGQPATNSVASNANRTEVATASLSPWLRGSLAGVADYEIRLTGSTTQSRASQAADSDSTSANFTLSSANRGARLGWSAFGSKQRVSFKDGARPAHNERAGAELTFAPDIDWRLGVTGGAESTDVLTTIRTEYSNYGANVLFTPSPRTRMSFAVEERYFGRGHRFLLEHRAARSVWRYADTRDASSSADANSVAQPVTLYQLLFIQYASFQPDPAVREVLVRELLRLQGRDPNEAVAGGFLTSGVSAQRRQELAALYNGPRFTANFAAFRAKVQRIDAAAAALPGGQDPIEQHGASATLVYRLTPQTSATVSGSQLATSASALGAATDTTSLSIGLTSQLARRLAGGLSLRYSSFDSAAPYRETALNASLSMSF